MKEVRWIQMEYMVLVIIGFVAGIIGALVGLGGGIIIVPSLLFFGNSTDAFKRSCY